MPYNLTSEEDFTQEEDYGEYEQHESNLAGQIYNRDDNEGGYKRVGMLIQHIDPQDTMLMSHPRKDFVKLTTGTKVANTRNHDMLAYHPIEGTAFTGKLDSNWIKEEICDIDHPKIPKNSVMNPEKVEKYKDKSNAYTIYINGANPTYKNIITEKLTDCVNKLSKQTQDMHYKKGYAEYRKNNTNNKHEMGFHKFVKQSKDMDHTKKIEKLASGDAERLSAYNEALANNQNSLNILNQMNVSKDELLNKNSYDINGINEKILTTSEKINNLKDKYDFNNKIIKLLRTITLWIFIITMFVLCYFGVRDKYIDTIKPTSKLNAKASK
jgi:hypothetical protein